MNLHTTTSVPVNDAYAALVGKAIYVFAYYEWTIIYLIDHLENGFVQNYSRGNPMTSGKVLGKLKEVVVNLNSLPLNITQQELDECISNFTNLITKRNALIHAHPCTNHDGAQILSYQTSSTKNLPDMSWPEDEVIKLISEIDEAACKSGDILDKLR